MSVDLSPFVLCRCAILEFKSGQEAASCVEGNKDVEVGDHKIRLSHCYPMPDHGQSRHSLGLIGGRGLPHAQSWLRHNLGLIGGRGGMWIEILLS